MVFDQDDVKRIKQMILFSILLIVAFWKYEVIFQMFSYILKIFFPFLLGGAIAFVLNVPMNFLEKKISSSKKDSSKKISLKMIRFISLGIVVVSVVCIVGVILFILIPRLIHTFQNIGNQLDLFWNSISLYFDKIGKWTAMLDWVGVDQKNFSGEIQKFFVSGTGGLWDSTFKIARGVVRGIINTLIAVVFSLYLLMLILKTLVLYTREKMAIML